MRKTGQLAKPFLELSELRSHGRDVIGLESLPDELPPETPRSLPEKIPDTPAAQLLARELAFDDPFTGQRRQFTSALQLAAAARRWPPADDGEPAPQSSARGATSVTGASGT